MTRKNEQMDLDSLAGEMKDAADLMRDGLEIMQASAEEAAILRARIADLKAALRAIRNYEPEYTDGDRNCRRLQDIATRALGHERKQ